MHRLFFSVGLVVVCATCTGCSIISVPDLTVPEASILISRTPEFNRYARLLNVRSVLHLKDSMDSVSYGLFTFVYLNSPPDTPPIKGWADFRYWEGKWQLNQFDYGCNHSGLDPAMQATDCHSVDVYKPPSKMKPRV